MPPRKRRTRRSDALTPAPVPPPASGPVPAPTAVEMPPAVSCLDARTGRAVQEVQETGWVFSHRPGDSWRGRLHLVWRPHGVCPACQKERMLLLAMTGEAAMCDLLHELDLARAAGRCTCAYAPQDG